jgi:hypothetical protein
MCSATLATMTAVLRKAREYITHRDPKLLAEFRGMDRMGMGMGMGVVTGPDSCCLFNKG